MANIKEPEMIILEKINSNKSKNKNIIKNKNNLSNLLENSLKNVKSKLSIITISPSTLHLLVKYVMEEVEIQHIKGSEQKDLSLELIKHLITDLSDEDDKEILLILLKTGTISNIIDLIIDATKRKLKINKKLNVISFIFRKK